MTVGDLSDARLVEMVLAFMYATHAVTAVGVTEDMTTPEEEPKTFLFTREQAGKELRKRVLGL